MNRLLSLTISAAGICILALVGIQCTSITDSSNSTYTYYKKAKPYFYRKDTLHFFYPAEGYTVRLQGPRYSELVTYDKHQQATNTSVDTSTYCVQFTTNRDTFLLENDTINGEAKFHLSDFKSSFSWDYLLKKFPDTLLMGKMLYDFLDDTMDSIMFVNDSGYKLTISHKNAVITALNQLVNYDSLYNRYRFDLNDLLSWDTTFTNKIDRLVQENIMDTTGGITGPLNTLQKQKLKRFNFDIFTKYLDSNPDEFIFTPFPFFGRVFTLLVEEGESPQNLARNATRYFKVTDSLMTQLYFIDKNNQKVTPQNSKVNGYYPLSGLNWKSSPVFPEFDLPMIPAQDIPNILSPGNTIIYFDSLIGSYENALKYYRMISNYSLTGHAVFEDGNRYAVTGYITMTTGFTNRSFGGTMYSIDNDRGYFSYVNISICFNAQDALGKGYAYTEKRILEADSLRTRL